MKRSPTEHLLAGMSGSLLIAIAGCTSGGQSVNSPAGPQASRINNVWWFMFWVCAVAFVLTMLSLAAAIWRRRKVAKVDHTNDSRRRILVTAASVLAIVALFSFLVAGAVAGKNVSRGLESKNALTIQVIGHQWWWEVVYNDPVASQTVTTANEIHIPVGKPIVILTSSRDVIHSFWAPNLNGKRDLIPGYQTAFWIQADKPGVYRGQCAEFCGHQHAHMSFQIIAESEDKFDAWRKAQVLPSAEPDDDGKRKGREVFLNHPCVMCHTIRGTDAGSRIGPDLTHVASRGTIAAGTLPNTPGNLAGWIMNSQSIKPGNRMPAMSLHGDELDALLAYLDSLK